MDGYDNAAVRAAISAERLARYVERCDGCEDNALTLYGFNMRMCEAFYTPLQCVEVCLRNQLHLAMTGYWASGWMTNGGPPLDPDAEEVIQKLVGERIDSGKAIEPPDLVAGMQFNFWVSLLAERYDSTLWRRALHTAFPNAKPKKRKMIHGRFNVIRRFRNRVAHHESILDRNPARVHEEIVQAIDWMCPHKAAWTSEHSQVPARIGELKEFLDQYPLVDAPKLNGADDTGATDK